MTSLNHVVLIGNLTRDAEIKYANSGYPITRLSLAVSNRVRKDNSWQEETSFFDMVLFGKLGETLQKYLVKGKQIGIQGQLRQNRWEHEGQTRSKVEIVVNDLQLLGGGRGAGPAQGGGEFSDETEDYAPRGGGASPKPAASQPAGDDFDDDIPF